MDELLQVGAITSTHGIAGEVKVFPTTDDVNRFKKLKEVICDTGKKQEVLHVISARFQKNMVILKFKEFSSINDVERLKGAKLLVTRDNAVKLQKDEYFIADMIGMKVIDSDGKDFGTLTDVLQTGANDVYVVDSLEHGEVLLPAIKECILDVNMADRFVKVYILPGLLD